MAEISSNPSAGKGRTRIRSKKHSTRIDMTPMVDLAFLLLTFFILTTTLNKLQVMEIAMPENATVQQPIPEKEVLTLILDEGDLVYWRQGISVPKLERIPLAHERISKLLMDKKTEISKLYVLIKSH